ncbi:hypothetical protein D3C81_1479920 [compost metagenome]
MLGNEILNSGAVHYSGEQESYDHALQLVGAGDAHPSHHAVPALMFLLFLAERRAVLSPEVDERCCSVSLVAKDEFHAWGVFYRFIVNSTQ